MGNARSASILTARYEEEKQGLALLMRQALLSARFDESLNASLEAAAPFSVDGRRWGFKPYLFVGGKLLYGGVDVWLRSKSEFAVSLALQAFTPNEKEAFLQTQIQVLSNKKIDLTAVRPVTIQHMDNYKLMGRGTPAGPPTTLHSTILFQDDVNKVYTLFGSARGRPKYWEKRFWALAESFKRK